MLKQALTLTVLAVVPLTVSACSMGGNQSATPPPFTPPESSPTSAVTPSQSSATEGAVEGYRRFIAATDATARSGGTDVSELRKTASGAMLGSELNQAATFRARRWRSTGDQVVVWAKVIKVGAPGADGKVSEAVVEACVDSSRAVASGPDGKPVRPAGTPTESVDQMKMVQVSGFWKADYPQSRKARQC